MYLLTNEQKGKTSQEFTYECGEMKELVENEKTPPCPKCRTAYIGIYDKKTFGLKGKKL